MFSTVVDVCIYVCVICIRICIYIYIYICVHVSMDAIQIPLVLSFFSTEDRIHALRSEDLQQVLNSVMFEPARFLHADVTGERLLLLLLLLPLCSVGWRTHSDSHSWFIFSFISYI